MKKIVLGMVLLLVAVAIYPAREGASLYNEVLRVRFVANSDSEEDQELKLIVRQRVLAEEKKILEDCTSKDEAKARLEESLPLVAKAAAEAVREAGHSYALDVSLGDGWYPRRDYGDCELPAGKYTGLTVTIGEGNGKNFWCILFPGLCGDLAADDLEQNDIIKKDKDTKGKIKFFLIEAFYGIERLWES